MSNLRFVSQIALLLLGWLLPQALAQEQLSFEEAQKRLLQSPQWKIIDQQYQLAERSLNIARGAAGLQVSLGADATRNQVSSLDPALNGTGLSASVSVQASLAVLPWSPVFDAVRAAERSLVRARLDVFEQRNNLQLQLLRQYLQVQLLATDGLLANQNLVFTQLRFQVTEAQFANKTATKETLLSAQAALKSAEIGMLNIKNSQILAERALFLTLGLPWREIQLSSQIAALEFNQDSAAAQIQKARSSSLAVQRAILAVYDAEDNLGIVQRDRWLPNLGLNAGISGVGADGRPTGTQANVNLNLGSGTLSANGAYSLTNSHASATSLSIQISIPIAAPSSDARIDAAQVALDSAKLNLVNTQNLTVIELENQFLEYQVAFSQLEMARANVGISEQRQSDTQARVQAGLSSLLELEQSKLQTIQSTRDALSTAHQLIISSYHFAASLKPLELLL